MYSSHDTLEYRTVIENEQGISSVLISMLTSTRTMVPTISEAGLKIITTVNKYFS